MNDIDAIMGNLEKIKKFKKNLDNNDPVVEKRHFSSAGCKKNRSVGIPLSIELKRLLEKYGVCHMCKNRSIVNKGNAEIGWICSLIDQCECDFCGKVREKIWKIRIM